MNAFKLTRVFVFCMALTLLSSINQSGLAAQLSAQDSCVSIVVNSSQRDSRLPDRFNSSATPSPGNDFLIIELTLSTIQCGYIFTSVRDMADNSCILTDSSICYDAFFISGKGVQFEDIHDISSASAFVEGSVLTIAFELPIAEEPTAVQLAYYYGSTWSDDDNPNVNTIVIPLSESISEDRVIVYGTVTHNGSPVCAMVLANGQYAFTCKGGDDLGKYALIVPLDSNGEVTIQSFVSGLAPFKYTTDSSDLLVEIDMQSSNPGSKSPQVTSVIESDASTPVGWERLTGTVALDGSPLCAMVLANGQYMFSCGVDNGVYDLTVPLDSNGQITLFVFVSGLQPYKMTFNPF